MNGLARKIVKIMEESLGQQAIFLYQKQCLDGGINPDAIRPEQVPILVERLKVVLPLFAGRRSTEILQEIESLRG